MEKHEGISAMDLDAANGRSSKRKRKPTPKGLIYALETTIASETIQFKEEFLSSKRKKGNDKQSKLDSNFLSERNFVEGSGEGGGGGGGGGMILQPLPFGSQRSVGLMISGSSKLAGTSDTAKPTYTVPKETLTDKVNDWMRYMARSGTSCLQRKDVKIFKSNDLSLDIFEAETLSSRALENTDSEKEEEVDETKMKTNEVVRVDKNIAKIAPSAVSGDKEEEGESDRRELPGALSSEFDAFIASIQLLRSVHKTSTTDAALKRAFLLGCRDFEEERNREHKLLRNCWIGDYLYDQLNELNPHVVPQDYYENDEEQSETQQWDLPSLASDLIRARHWAARHMSAAGTGKKHKIEIGTTIEVFWPKDKSWHTGTIVRISHDTGNPMILYNCGQLEGLDPSARHVRIRLLKNRSLTEIETRKKNAMMFTQGMRRMKLAIVPHVEAPQRRQIMSLFTSEIMCDEEYLDQFHRYYSQDFRQNQHSTQVRPAEEISKQNDRAPVSAPTKLGASNAGDNPNGADDFRMRTRASILKFTRSRLAQVWVRSNRHTLMAGIRAMLDEIGISQRTISRLIGCAQSTFSLWLGGNGGRMYVESKLHKWLKPEIDALEKEREDQNKTPITKTTPRSVVRM